MDHSPQHKGRNPEFNRFTTDDPQTTDASLRQAVARNNPPRNYETQVCERVAALSSIYSTSTLSIIAHEGRRLPIFGIDTAPLADKPGGTIFISGGVHGEEPAGVSAVFDFLEHHAQGFTEHFRFRVIPCVNPFGYESNTRCGTLGFDLNRNFKENSQLPEVQATLNFLKQGPGKLRAAFDLHEIDIFWADEGFSCQANPLQFYFYESTRNPEQRVGAAMLIAAAQFGEACSWDTIYGDKNSNGVVYYPEANPAYAKRLGYGAGGTNEEHSPGNLEYAAGTSLEAFLFEHYTEHSFTFETPIHWPVPKRVQVQRALLLTALGELGLKNSR